MYYSGRNCTDPRSFVDILPEISDGLSQTKERIGDLCVASLALQLNIVS